MLVNKECLSSFSSACGLGNNHTPLSVSHIVQNHAHPHSAEFTGSQRCLFAQQRQAFIIFSPQEKTVQQNSSCFRFMYQIHKEIIPECVLSPPAYLCLCVCVCVRWWSCGWRWTAGRGRSGSCCWMGLWSRPPRRCGMTRGKSPRPDCWVRSKLLNTRTRVPRSIRAVNLNRWAARIKYSILSFILDT